MTKEIEYNKKKFKVNYKHFRKKDLSPDATHVVIAPKGGKTIGGVEISRFAHIVAIAECSKKDTFYKKVGRELVHKRLTEMLTRLTPVKD